MAWMQGQTTDYKDLLVQVKDFITKQFASGAVTRTSGSYGNVYGASAGVATDTAEVWTLTCTKAGTNDEAEFTVASPSESGYPVAVAGIPYSQPKVSFTIAADPDSPANDFVIGDAFQFSMAASDAEWVVDRYSTDRKDDGSNEVELIAHGLPDGVGGTDKVYVAYNTLSDLSEYFNWQVSGLSGFVDHTAGLFDKPIELQPGYKGYYDPLNNSNPFDFCCIFTARHIKVMCTISGAQTCNYVGWLLPYATPSQWSYPMFVGATTKTSSQKAGVFVDSFNNYWQSRATYDTGAVKESGDWRELLYNLPRQYGSFTEWRPGAFDNEMRLYPASPLHPTTKQIYGQWEGVYWPTPYVPDTGLLTASDVIISGDIVALCFQDVNRSQAGSIIAMDLIGDPV